MKIKNTISIAVLLIMAFTGSAFSQEKTHPNVIIIITDDQGYGDLGITGNPHVKTPVIDKFANENIRFNKFYVSPVCAPTRSSLMTGRFSLRTGVRDTYNGGATMASNEFTIAEMLKQASVGILICFDTNLQHDEGYGPIDCSAATQNMLLAAHGLGLGACWIGIYPRQNRIDALHKVFELPEHVKPFAVISVGYSNEKKSKPERFKKERIHIEKWN